MRREWLRDYDYEDILLVAKSRNCFGRIRLPRLYSLLESACLALYYRLRLYDMILI